MEQRNVVKQAKADMSLFMTPTSEGKKATKKGTEKAPASDLCKEYKALYKKAMFAKETAKNQKEAAATKMFQFYVNLLF